jgi:hypothetical protein
MPRNCESTKSSPVYFFDKYQTFVYNLHYTSVFYNFIIKGGYIGKVIGNASVV